MTTQLCAYHFKLTSGVLAHPEWLDSMPVPLSSFSSSASSGYLILVRVPTHKQMFTITLLNQGVTKQNLAPHRASTQLCSSPQLFLICMIFKVNLADHLSLWLFAPFLSFPLYPNLFSPKEHRLPVARVSCDSWEMRLLSIIWVYISEISFQFTLITQSPTSHLPCVLTNHLLHEPLLYFTVT